MAPPPLHDLTHLLAEVASRLARPPGGAGPSSAAGDSLSANVSSLAAALNPGAAAPASSGTRVLDAALSLMCFDPQEVDRARLDCLVRTAVSALSDSASCRVARTDDRAEMLCVGSSVSPRDCRELVRSCAALVEKLGGRDVAGHSYDLLHAAVKTALLSPRYQCLFPSPYYREDGESSCEMGTISLDVTTHPSYQVLPSDGSIPPRVHLWHYDPSILKHDLSEMLREAITRPLLCLRKELHDRVAWRVIVICLVCSPPAFLEMRSLFHIWFLATGMGSVLGLCTAVVSSVIDLLLEPMGWGISMELGQKFPFTHAYFPSQQRDLLAILTGPISCRRFLDLVSYIEVTVFLGKTSSDDSSWKNIQSQPPKGSHFGKKQPSKGLVKFIYSSAWLTITNFPTWFNFATALLFHQEGSQGYLSEVLSEEKTAESISDISLAQRAAFYLSWVLCPSNVDECQLLAKNMVELSHSWARNNKRRPSYAHHTSTVNHRRKLRVPTVRDTEKLNVSTNPVSSLIKDFDDRCVKFCRISAVSQVQGAEQLDVPLSCPNFLHLRVPLGVLLVSSACISEQDCNVLLHYASTGLVMESKEGQTKRKDQAGNDVFSSSRGGSSERWALSGACLIFGWLDIIEDMSAVIFECEDTCRHFVSQLRTKTGPYLLKCVNLLLNEAGHDKDFVIDLRDKLLNWTNKGQRFDGCEAFKDVIVQMNAKIQPSS
ncbi:hypothetical protein CFC21_107334 [Triticum aestivum]|uniref:Uncharacterized protein n=2 Tax=Triticum aestivum TaxID=4565 RepID=A0A9R1NAH7_WHEAT|nr:uncharacterized protein LOC123168907 [Triticum aestivum]KAF7106616.1 hypothetical protein CFC21_107334 [Triticum aestivum]